MGEPLSLLVVDVSEDWEEVLKAQERGYEIDFDNKWPGSYLRNSLDPNRLMKLHYPHGSVRAGFNAVIDTTRIAHQLSIPIYAAEYYDGWTDGEEQTCFSLQWYIPKVNRYEKGQLSAFRSSLAERLKTENCQHLMVIGYDRDDCVMATIRDAVERGITVVTSEHCMLTTNRDNRRDASLAYFKENTVFLETLVDVRNYISNSVIRGR